MTAPQDLWAIPLARTLVDAFRSQDVTYVKVAPGVYDPATGIVAATEERFPAAGAVTQWMKGEREGVGQGAEVQVWVEHQTVPWPISTDDRLEFLGRRWKVVKIDPTLGSGGDGVPSLTTQPPKKLTTQDGIFITTQSGAILVREGPDGFLVTQDGQRLILGKRAPTIDGWWGAYASKVTARAE